MAHPKKPHMKEKHMAQPAKMASHHGKEAIREPEAHKIKKK